MKRSTSTLVGIVGVAMVCGCGGADDNLLFDGGADGNADGNNAGDVQNQDVQKLDSPSDAPSDAISCPSFCGAQSPTPTFCSDFDNESTPADWTITDTTNGGTVTIGQTEETSCPNGLAVSIPQITVKPSNTSQAKVVKSITALTTANHAILKLEGYLPANDTQSYVIFFGVRSTTDVNSGIYLTHHGDAFWFLTSNNFGMNIPITVPPLTGAWNAMTLDVVFAAQSGSVSFTYTGNDNTTHVVTGNGMTAANPVTSTTVEVGMVATGTTEAAFSAYYDSVVLTTE